MKVQFPFPPASLAGHNNGHWRTRERDVATLRAQAFHLTKVAKREHGYTVPAEGDICVHIHFVPANDRGDRVNYPIRVKPLLDGLAEALGVNDKRFLPVYTFGAPDKPGCVEVVLS